VKVLEERKKRTLQEKWRKLTSGWLGYIVYGGLGILAAYLFYYGSGIILRTDVPFVAVVSSSMDHGITGDSGLQKWPCQKEREDFVENFDNWWISCGVFYASIGITKEEFHSFPFSNGFKKGDLPIVQGSDSYKVGDIIVFAVPGQPAPIIHRIVKINEDGTFQTKGDHNSGQNPYELSIAKNQIKGKVIFIIPKLGYFKVLLSELVGI
jgi:signal peptidase I